jgi:signal transduction histidine kinase/CheY-like chemotaxis protein
MSSRKVVEVAALPEPEHAGSDHLVQFYEDPAFLRDAVTRFLAEGVVAGDKLLVIATPEHLLDFAAGLAGKGVDVERVRASGRLALRDARETLAAFMVDGSPDPERFRATILAALPGEGTRIRAFGEMVDLLWRDGNTAAAIELEELWNGLCREQPLRLLCAYALGNFYREADGPGLRQVCATHAHVMPAESYSAGGSEEAQLREVTFLQQRALALETELTQRRQLEDALRAAQSQAEAASRAKDEFLAMLGHELRNPLAPILTALELFKLRGDQRTSREQEVIERQTRHLIRLVDDLLDVSRIARGAVELRRQEIELRDVLAKATEIAGPLLEQRRHQFEVRTSGTLRLDGDEARLAQVVANLLTNAARYTPPGGHVVLEARRDGTELLIEVRDDGIGIGPDLLPRIFDLFVQGRQSTDRAEGGLGIGLALVRNLVALHGGTVSARSPGPGKGSTFSVRLPALLPREERVASQGIARAGRAPVRSKRILVVDDNADALEMLLEMLSEAGHEVAGATSGTEALDLVREFKPEIAILDIGLPAMDGYELARRIRSAMAPDAPRLMALTGYGQESDRRRSTDAGFALHLVKPLEAGELLATIDRA